MTGTQFLHFQRPDHDGGTVAIVRFVVEGGVVKDDELLRRLQRATGEYLDGSDLAEYCNGQPNIGDILDPGINDMDEFKTCLRKHGVLDMESVFVGDGMSAIAYDTILLPVD